MACTGAVLPFRSSEGTRGTGPPPQPRKAGQYLVLQNSVLGEAKARERLHWLGFLVQYDRFTGDLLGSRHLDIPGQPNPRQQPNL